MAVTFHIDNRTDKKGESPVRVSVYIAGTRLLTNTGYKIDPSRWDTDKQRVRKGAVNALGMTWNRLNAVLAKISEHFAGYEAECIARGMRPDKEALRLEFLRHFGRTRNSDATGPSGRGDAFLERWNEFTSEMGMANSWRKPTYQKFAALLNHLQRFRRDIGFDDFSEKGLSEFMNFLREEEQLRNTTALKQWGFLKWFLRWAAGKGYLADKSFQSFTPRLRTVPRKVIFLEWDELMRVYNYEVPANGTEVKLRTHEGMEYLKVVEDAAALVKTRDMFCFCCFTSLRYSDAANLKRADISGDIMTITTVKTADTVTIELNKYARRILERVKARHAGGDLVFPHLTNQRMNIYLKNLCELCGINQPVAQTYYVGSERHDEVAPKFALIGTHAGRRTFICNALSLGIPANIVMKWTGHSDYKAMQPYIDIASSAKARAMSRFDEI